MAQFKVKDGTAYYQVEALDDNSASYFGCDGSKYMLIGNHGHMIGNIVPVTGKVVTVPGWSTRKGMLATFTPWGFPETGESFKGYLTVN